MTGGAGCRSIRQALGVYVLGAIDPAERALVDNHLVTCPECREELASLAGLPALLRRVPISEAERLAAHDSGADGDMPSPELLPALLARATQVRRVRRWRGLAAAAAVVVFALGAGAAGATALTGGPAAAPAAAHSWHTVSGKNLLTGASMTVKYAPTKWGTTMDVQVAGIPSGTVCQFQVTDAAGRHWVVGGWRVNYQGGHSWYPASTALPDAQLRSFQVTAGGTVIAQVKTPPG